MAEQRGLENESIGGIPITENQMAFLRDVVASPHGMVTTVHGEHGVGMTNFMRRLLTMPDSPERILLIESLDEFTRPMLVDPVKDSES